MQNQGNGQNMKSRNQKPDSQMDPQAAQMQHKKKNQHQDKSERS